MSDHSHGHEKPKKRWSFLWALFLIVVAVCAVATILKFNGIDLKDVFKRL